MARLSAARVRAKLISMRALRVYTEHLLHLVISVRFVGSDDYETHGERRKEISRSLSKHWRLTFRLSKRFLSFLSYRKRANVPARVRIDEQRRESGQSRMARRCPPPTGRSDYWEAGVIAP